MTGNEEMINALAERRFNIEKAIMMAELAIMRAQLVVLGGFADLIELIDQAIGDLGKLDFDEEAGRDPRRHPGSSGWDVVDDSINDQTDRLEEAIKGLAETMGDLLIGKQSVLSPEAKMAEATRRYTNLLTKAQNGDVAAINQLSAFVPDYLRLAESFFGGTATTGYGDLFARLFDDISGITGENLLVSAQDLSIVHHQASYEQRQDIALGAEEQRAAQTVVMQGMKRELRALNRWLGTDNLRVAA